MKEPTPQQTIVNYFFRLKGWDYTDPKYKPIYSRWVKVAMSLLRMADNQLMTVKEKVDAVRTWAEKSSLSWNLSTVEKRWLENNETKKKPYTIDGDELIQKGDQWLVRIWDGSIKNYGGNKKDIIWR